MIVSLIVAMDENNGIGFQGQIPWKLSSDLRRFKTLTLRHHIIMGRITWESIGRALPDRVNIVLSRSKSFQDQRCLVLSSLEEALNFAEHNGETEAFIIGGENIYNLAMPFAQRIYLTLVHASLPVDTYFPDINWDEWSIQSSQKFPASPSDQFSSTFTILIRKKFNPASN